MKISKIRKRKLAYHDYEYLLNQESRYCKASTPSNACVPFAFLDFSILKEDSDDFIDQIDRLAECFPPPFRAINSISSFNHYYKKKMEKIESSVLCYACQEEFFVFIKKQLIDSLEKRTDFMFEHDCQLEKCPHCGYISKIIFSGFEVDSYQIDSGCPSVFDFEKFQSKILKSLRIKFAKCRKSKK